MYGKNYHKSNKIKHNVLFLLKNKTKCIDNETPCLIQFG